MEEKKRRVVVIDAALSFNQNMALLETVKSNDMLVISSLEMDRYEFNRRIGDVLREKCEQRPDATEEHQSRCQKPLHKRRWYKPRIKL